MPLQQLSILNCELVPKRPVELINESNVIYNDNETANDISDFDDHNYTILCATSNLSNFAEEIVVYIAGFIAKKLGSLIKCERCVGTLYGTQENLMGSLLSLKDRGGLTYPSKDVIYVCKETEVDFRQTRKITARVNPNKISAGVLAKCGLKDIFSCLLTENHKYLMIKAIAVVRIRYNLRNLEPADG